MNWAWIIALMEKLAEIFSDCPERNREKRQDRVFAAARGQTRLGRRKLLKAIRQTPKTGLDGEVLLVDGKPQYPRGRETLVLFSEVTSDLAEMSDDELKEEIGIVDEMYEDGLEE